MCHPTCQQQEKTTIFAVWKKKKSIGYFLTQTPKSPSKIIKRKSSRTSIPVIWVSKNSRKGWKHCGYITIEFKRKPKTQTHYYKNFLDQLETVLDYGIIVFGEQTAQQFKDGIMARIMMLPAFSHANPKNRFVKSSKRKTYRYIIYEKYFVIYSVTKSTIRVISTIHQAINPKTVKRIK